MQATKPIRNPGKQRKRLFNAPAHIRHKLMAAPLSPELLAQRGIKTLPVRKGDTVRIMRGDHKGFEGKISRVDLKHYRIYLEGLTREKVDGTAVFVGVHPSKVMIKTLNLDDKVRKAILERKKPIIKKKPQKAAKKAVAPKKVAEEEKAEEVKEEIVEVQPAIAVPEAPAEVKAPPEEAIAEKVPEEKPKAKAAPAKKRAARKKTEQAEEKPAEEKPAGKAEKPKAAKKTAAKEEAPKTAAKKPAAKRKTPSKAEGGT
jgi:large subunit ribosomal protein L24